MVKKPIIKKLLKYRELLEQNGVPVKHMILFGSYAHGKPGKVSDIDVCIVSPKLGKDRIEEGKKLFLLAIRIDPLIEPVAFSTVQYLRNRTSPLLHQIKNTGIKII